ncbi:uncharacterized protein LOC128393858 [Panonychus citri]|uniref:uncharacterized protein LOC128393858 n=1 Tax=Panonychus citri TaxID=50023 RepID=UPI00230754B4|nr:uncharacterized protein LOC128393858 [Panonychus citri]
MSTQIFLVLSAVFVLFTINSSITYGAPSSPVYTYNVTVKTSSAKFDDHNGKLKMSIMYRNGTKSNQEDILLTPDDINIARDRTYNSTIASFAPLANITSVYLRWTLKSPYNPKYVFSKPSIYFDPIAISYKFFDPNLHSTVIQSRRFCPPTSPVAIKHSDGANFFPCA